MSDLLFVFNVAMATLVVGLVIALICDLSHDG